MDRQELDARIRQRRPGEARLRRGTPLDGADAAPAGYVPFEPDPEDSRAMREPAEPPARIDNTPDDFDAPPAPRPEPVSEPAAQGFQPEAEAPRRYVEPAQPAYDDRSHAAPQYATGQPEAPGEPFEPYGAPEDAYPDDPPGDGERRRGSAFLPILGFAALAVLALGVGAGVAAMLGGRGVAQASPTPTVSESAAGSASASGEASPSPDGSGASPEPTDGPVVFPDGAEITVQPCATKEMSFDGCAADGATISEPTMWVWIGFKGASGSDSFTLELQSDGQTIDQQENKLGSVVTCPGTCNGYLIGAAYRDLGAGDYDLIVRRNGDFADSATFTVE